MDGLSAVAASLQLGEQLVKVTYGAWKLGQKLEAAPRQIRRKRVHVDQLHAYIQAIQGLFQGPNEQHDPRSQATHLKQLDALQSLLDKIQKEFDDLDQILKPLETALGSDHSSERFWARVQALKREASIHGSLDRLRELATHLHYFVELYNLELFCSNATRVGSTLKDITGGQTQLSETVTKLDQKLDRKALTDAQAWSMNRRSQASILAQNRLTQRKIDAIDASLDLGFNTMTNTVGRDLGEVSKDLKAIQRSVQLLAAERLASKPSLVASVIHQSHRVPRGDCPCQRSGKSTPRKFGPVTWVWRDYGIHRPGCPYLSIDQQDTMANRYSLTVEKLASRTIEFVFSSARVAGGFAIPDHIDIIRIVSDEHNHVPGFDRLSDASSDIEKALSCDPHRQSNRRKASPTQTKRVKQILLRLLEDLDADFRKGRFSARMQTASGKTLLHKFVEIMMAIWTMQEEVASVVEDVIKLLLRHGTPLNATMQSYQGDEVCERTGQLVRPIYNYDTALSLCLESLRPYDVVSPSSRLFLQALSDFGVESIPPDARQIRSTLTSDLFLCVPDVAIEYGCSRLALAVIHREAYEVQNILKTKGVQDSETPMPLTPLSFCIDWHPGMRLLLEAGANASEAIHCAIDHDDDVGLEILLNAGARLFIPAEHSRLPSWTLSPFPESLLEHALWRRRCRGSIQSRILPLIINAVVEARQRLMTLARTHMSVSQRKRLGWVTPEADQPLLDSTIVTALFEQLQKQGVDVPDAIQPDHRGLSIYQTPWMTADVAEALFRAGFHDVDMSAADGSTPLLRNTHTRCLGAPFETREMMLWFLNHGAKKLTYPELNGISLCQKLAADLVHEFAYRCSKPFKENWQEWLPLVLARMSTVSPEPLRDNCTCYCSNGGCSPVTTLLRHLHYSDYSSRTRTKATEYNLWDERQQMFKLWWQMNPPRLKTGAHSDLSRFELFDRLGMRHTCCQFRTKDEYDCNEDYRMFEYLGNNLLFVDRDESAEFQDEDRYLNYVLTRVMALFDQLSVLYRRHHAVFWNGWWTIIEENIPTVRRRRYPRRKPERIDQEIPILEEGSLEDILQDIREHVSSWVDVKVLQENDMLLDEGMAWLTSIVEE